MIKKIYKELILYLPVLILGFILMPSIVSAETITAQPDQVNFYKGYTNTLIFSDTSANNYTIAGNTFYGYSTGSSVSDAPLSARVFYKNSQFSSVPKKKTSTLMFTMFSTAKISSIMLDTNSNYFTCNILNTTFVDSDQVNQAIVYSVYCPKFQFVSSNLYINVNFATDNGINQPLGILNTFTYIIDENANINNSIQEGNNKLDEMNDNITNSNTTDADNKGSSFFDGFSTTDHGGISGIITAPLVSINQMLNGTCVPLSTTYKGQEISLPCGYEFWDKMPEIKNFWNLIGGGMLCYSIILKLFKLIERLKNPDDDRVEVLEL